MIVINAESDIPLYQQIYEQIKKSIITGQIQEGSKLTSTRILSAALNVSRNTVEYAYQQLCSEGYIASKAGSGYIAIKLDSFEVPNIQGKNLKNFDGATKVSSDVMSINYKYNFCYGNLNTSNFPLSLWKKLSNKCLSLAQAENFTSYPDRKGEMDLRIELIKYLKDSRGVSCIPDQIIISSGMEYSLSLLCQLLRGEYDQIALEDPGYRGAKKIIMNNGYKVIPIGIDKDGIDLEELENSSAKIVYVTPSHQFPTGLVMPIQKRMKLIDWAERKHGFIIEDDYDSELRYNSKPIPALQGIDPKGCVIYIGTLSKALSPSLRFNYMVLPQPLLELYDKLFDRYQVTVPYIQQKMIQQFMNQGYWEKHLRKICLSNRRKHDLLVRTIHECMGDKVIIHGKNAGLHILLEFKNGLCEREIIEKAKNNGILVFPVSVYWMRPERYPDNMILLGYGEMSENEIADGIKALGTAIFK